MTKKIFLSIITICSLSVVAAIIIVTAILYGASAELAASEVRTDAKLIASAVEKSGDSYFESADIDNDIRVTWIGRDGKVLFDSEEEAAELASSTRNREAAMKAHAERKMEQVADRIVERIVNG